LRLMVDEKRVFNSCQIYVSIVYYYYLFQSFDVQLSFARMGQKLREK
jgi:hypothetical protein